MLVGEVEEKRKERGMGKSKEEGRTMTLTTYVAEPSSGMNANSVWTCMRVRMATYTQTKEKGGLPQSAGRNLQRAHASSGNSHTTAE